MTGPFGTASSSFFFYRDLNFFLHIFCCFCRCCFQSELGFGRLENPVEDQKVEWVHEQENDPDAVSTTLGFTEGLPPTSGVVEVLNE
jgi:hypothetical protein